MGILTSKFYLSNKVPVIEKLIGLLVIAILLYIVISIIKNHAKTLFCNMKQISPVYVGALLTLFVLFFVKTIDGIGRKLGDLNIFIGDQTSLYFEVIEEVLELFIPLLIMSTLLMYFSIEKHDKKVK